MTEVVEGQPICGAAESRCVCVLPVHGDDVPHECDPIACGGSWRYRADGEFEAVRWPMASASDPGVAALGGVTLAAAVLGMARATNVWGDRG